MNLTQNLTPKAAEKDSVVTPFAGLEELSQQTYEIPFTELAPHLQRDIQARVKRLAADDMLDALKDLSAMYTRAWDLVDGGLVMFKDSIKRFEAAHAKAIAAIAKAEGQAK